MNSAWPPPLVPLRLMIAAPRGFCAGVDRAILIVERAIEQYGAPVYVRHEIVHNRFVVDSGAESARRGDHQAQGYQGLRHGGVHGVRPTRKSRLSQSRAAG